jgi:hypothetical protein
LDAAGGAAAEVIPLLLLLLAGPDGASYDDLLARAVADGREGRTESAGRALDRAIALDPGRPEAWVERGGLRFLLKQYDDAIADLETALRIRDDAYARDLLASTLLLTGRSDPAIEEWNRLGKPTLGAVRIVGLRHASEPDVRREVTVDEGARLDVRDYRRTRLRLEESGFFHAVEMRPVAAAPGTVDLEIDVLERHGFGGIPELVGRGVADLSRKKVRLQYANLGGGITLGGEYKWEDTQPFLGFTLDAFRPFGLPAMISIDGLRSRPSYDLEDGHGPFRLRTRGGGVRGRMVVASRTVAEAGLRVRDRAWNVARADTAEGTLVGLHLGLDHTFWAGRRHDLAGSVRMLTAPNVFTRALGRVVHHLHVQRPDGLPLEHGSIAAQVQVGYSGDGTPLEEMFAPGAASDMELPLRGHRQKTRGILGRAPIARSIALLNFEWRQRLARTRLGQVGYILFYDGGWMGRTARGGTETVHDVGVGLRFGLRGALLLRADYGWGLTDGKSALTGGIGQVF